MARAKKNRLAMLFLDGIVLLPNMTVQIDIRNRDSWAVNAVTDSMNEGRNVFITCKKDKELSTEIKNVECIGVVASIHSITRGLPDGKIRVNIHGQFRGELKKIYDDENYFSGDIVYLEDKDEAKDKSDEELASERAMRSYLEDLFYEYCKTSMRNIPNLDARFKNEKCLSNLIDNIAGVISISERDKAEILKTVDIKSRLYALAHILETESEVNRIKASIAKDVKSRVDKNQHEYVLREQLKAINTELGYDKDDSEIDEYREKLNNIVATDDVKSRINKEIEKCQRIKSDSSEGNVQRNYVETLLEMPWDKVKTDSTDIDEAEKILNRDHYGLDKVKERVLEFLSVRLLTEKGDSPIICLVGPPGTGKTSIAKSVAEALNKEYVRISLGGIHDEAEIRGHRRTYVGALPGRIANGLKQAGVKNPLMVLDEIDKASSDHHGDTSSALLEVLDSEQNSKFRDHYIDIPLDLSEVMFIATANDRNTIPKPLYDRMEIIEVSGYTANEKFHIARGHLVKKQLAKNGIKSSSLKISDSAIKSIIQYYTKEAGVRGLERQLGKICRKAARLIVQDGNKTVSVTAKNLDDFLGVKKYDFDKANKKNEIGIVRGLAWTAVGGDTLQIEVNMMPGKGEIILTGQLGDVMQESARIGMSYIRSIATKCGIKADIFKENDFHIHVPQGAVPKDGPSAGVTMATALYSVITNKPVRRDLAMTGEITLRGWVLPIGGLKEKLLAAKTAGIKTVLVPIKNEPDVLEIDEEIKDGLEIVFVETMDEVLRRAIL